MTSVAVDAAARAWGQRRVRLGLAIEVEPHGQHHARAAVAEDDLGGKSAGILQHGGSSGPRAWG